MSKQVIESFKRLDFIEKGLIVLMGLGVAFFLFIMFLYPIQLVKQAEWYTKQTGEEVTWVDAFFLDLDPSKHVIIIENKGK